MCVHSGTPIRVGSAVVTNAPVISAVSSSKCFFLHHTKFPPHRVPVGRPLQAPTRVSGLPAPCNGPSRTYGSRGPREQEEKAGDSKGGDGRAGVGTDFLTLSTPWTDSATGQTPGEMSCVVTAATLNLSVSFQDLILMFYLIASYSFIPLNVKGPPNVTLLSVMCLIFFPLAKFLGVGLIKIAAELESLRVSGTLICSYSLA